MNKIKKKLFGAAGLLVVSAMTFVAAIIPPVGTYATSETINVSVKLPSASFSATFTSPINHAQLVNNTGTLQVHYANATHLEVSMTNPDSSSVVIQPSTATPDPTGGTVPVPFALSQGYGDYGFDVSGTDLIGENKQGTPISVAHHSAFYEIIPTPDANGDPITRVTYGPSVCGVRFAIVSQDDPSKAVTHYPALSEPPLSCKTADPDQDGIFDIVIPMSKLNLDAGRYKITMIAYGCLNGQPDPENELESNLPPTGDLDQNGNYIFDPENEYTPPEIPNTGMISIGGMMIAQKDLTLAAIIAIVAVIGTFYSIKNRRQNKR